MLDTTSGKPRLLHKDDLHPHLHLFQFYGKYVCWGKPRLPGEAATSTVSSFEFQRKFGRFQHGAQREPVEITRHGRREFVLLSAEQYDWLRASAQRSHRTESAADVVAGALERAEMDAKHEPLDELLK